MRWRTVYIHRWTGADSATAGVLGSWIDGWLMEHPSCPGAVSSTAFAWRETSFTPHFVPPEVGHKRPPVATPVQQPSPSVISYRYAGGLMTHELRGMMVLTRSWVADSELRDTPRLSSRLSRPQRECVTPTWWLANLGFAWYSTLLSLLTTTPSTQPISGRWTTMINQPSGSGARSIHKCRLRTSSFLPAR